ncbi:DUF4153 domain-containing protein [Sphingomonas sp. HDW15A]|uniref:DUF4153 domain-containing protein n=1 Tax=Sphingomonas sp. HDW15A TaxID=2714942 RepID=UPI001408886E|nr:DUF4153 domain-containing protein [Sphingomonas sp. HDW15A]QIK96002.1 DUF4153 domain-containing protein [Sphingomonas sp. HDW15A]
METVQEVERGWPIRPWLLAAVGAAAGLVFWFLVDMPGGADPTSIRQASAAFVLVTTVSFLITAERFRLSWAAAFALVWGAIIGMIGFYTATYNFRGEIVEFPFLSALLAVGIAGPLFQVLRDCGRPALPYAPLHRYVWDDAIIGAASLAFTGLTFLLAFLLAQLFDAIGVAVLKDLLDEGWFDWMLAGAAFGTASAILRERAPLLATLQRLVTVIVSVLAPVFASALVLFLIALPATGLAGLWKSGVPETPLLLAVAAFAFIFLNAIIGGSPDDRSKGRLWRLTEIGLLGSVLPLGVLAFISMSMRVDQYGWTPERLWGVIACGVAIAFGIANWLAFAMDQSRFDVRLRDYQKKLAVGVCGLALLLAMPILDFGKISSRSQLARLESGKVSPAEFDWAAMAFDFGPSGRRALSEIARNGSAETRSLASRVLESNQRFIVQEDLRSASAEAGLDRQVRLASPDIRLDPPLRRYIARSGQCASPARCLLVRIDERRLALVSVHGDGRAVASSSMIDLDQVTAGKEPGQPASAIATPPVAAVSDLKSATVEVRDVQRRQIFLDGKPVGAPFE